MSDDRAKRDSADDFLDAEEAAKNLVVALDALKTETEGYATAERSLRASGERLISVAARLEELSTRAAEALDVVRSAGGPQIVEELKSIAPVLEHQGELLSSHGGVLTAIQDRINGVEGAIASVEARLQEARQAQDAEAERLHQSISSVQTQAEEAWRAQNAESEKLHQRLAAMQSRLQAMVVGVAAGLVIVVVLIIVGFVV